MLGNASRLIMAGAIFVGCNPRGASAPPEEDAGTTSHATSGVAVATSASGEAPPPSRRSTMDGGSGECPSGMKQLRAGTYALGPRSREPAAGVAQKPHEYVVKVPLCVDTHEITVAAYTDCVRRGRCEPAGSGDGCTSASPSRRNHPVNCVLLSQATRYCDFVGKRLPREDEWEAAARGPSGSSGVFAFDDSVLPLAMSRSFCLKRAPAEGTCAVTAVPPEGGLGIRGLSGNVREWTSSTWCPEIKCKDLVAVRGGYWSDFLFPQVNYARRYVVAREESEPHIGFRCVVDL